MVIPDPILSQFVLKLPRRGGGGGGGIRLKVSFQPFTVSREGSWPSV